MTAAADSRSDASSSRPSATSGTPTGTYETGIDTVRLLLRVRDEGEQRRASDELRRPTPLPGGEGLVAGYVPSYELLWVEGRFGRVMGLGTGLLPASGLVDAAEEVQRLVREAGYRSVREVGPSRVDVTATVGMSRAADGLAVLRGMGGLDVPRRITRIYAEPGRVQSVAKLTPAGTVRERIYDKGAELNVDEPGRRVRFEGQTRPRGEMRTTSSWWTMERVRQTFQKSFAPMATAGQGLRVASESTIREQLRDLAERGVITARQAELLMGHIAAQSVGLRVPRRTYFRRRGELRRLGLALALDGQEEDVSVDLGEVLTDVVTSERWSA